METIKIKSLYSGELHRYFEKDDNIIRCGNVVLSVNEPVELQIEGCINSFDIIFLRSLCGGGTSFRINRMPAYVKILNLLNVTFESDDTPYFETHSDFRSAVYGTKPKTITSYMFAKLKGMEAVNDYGCIRKGFCDDSKHAVREVHGNFLDLLSLFLRYLHKNIDNV